MQVPISNRTLLRSLMAGAIVLLGAGACSRSDRVESGSDNTAATTQDTAVSGPLRTRRAPVRIEWLSDTTNATSENTGTGAAAGDTAPARVQSNAPRAATASPSAERPDTSASAESGAAGYRATERDTAAQPESDSARVTEDTSEHVAEPGDTSSVETAGAAVTSDTTAPQRWTPRARPGTPRWPATPPVARIRSTPQPARPPPQTLGHHDERRPGSSDRGLDGDHGAGNH